MRFFANLRKPKRTDGARQARLDQLNAMGFEVLDRRGWFEGKFSKRRYFLARNGEVVAGPFYSSKETLFEATKLANAEKQDPS